MKDFLVAGSGVSRAGLAAVAGVAAVSLAVAVGGGFADCGSSGPDVVVSEIPAIHNYQSRNGIEAFSIGTTACNAGDEELDWNSGTAQHPVIGQNMYRLRDGRFEQVGQSWLKHGFSAFQGDSCGCGCVSSGTGLRLGVGCSDPYGAYLNGIQSGLGPKHQVNPGTGVFTWPPADFSSTGDSIYKRLQVAIADLDPAQRGAGSFYVEGQYVTPDDAAAGNQDNNVSWCEASISGCGVDWEARIAGPTHPAEPAIMAWALSDPSVSVTVVDAPGDGRFYLGWSAADRGGGVWAHELALYNMNSDRAAQAVRVTLPAGATVSDTGFHDVDYHSGEPYDGTDWTVATGSGEIAWATDAWSVNPNANALRWGTLYNFRFRADAGPAEVTQVQIDLFKPGTPTSIVVPLSLAVDASTTHSLPRSRGFPSRLRERVGVGVLEGVFPDCNDNGIDDAMDISAGTSLDCDGGPIGAADDGERLWTPSCASCHGADGSGGAGGRGPDVRDTPRADLWAALLPPTSHSGGAFPDLTQQDFADLEAFLDTVGGSGGRPDRLPDECQTLCDCDNDGVADGCELDGGTQLDLDYNGIPDACEAPCTADTNADGVVNVTDLVAVILAWGTADPAADVNDDGAVDVQDLVAVILGWGPCP